MQKLIAIFVGIYIVFAMCYMSSETKVDVIASNLDTVQITTASVIPVPINTSNIKSEPVVTKSYAMSASGIEMIKKHETCKLTAYWDSNGYSIGYGHHGKDVYKGMTISKKQADKYLKEDIAWVNEAINRMLTDISPNVVFSQKFVDGLGDLIYNCGETGVRKSEFWNRMKRCRIKNNKINISDYNFTIAAVKNCRVSCKGHIPRRIAVMKLMLS